MSVNFITPLGTYIVAVSIGASLPARAQPAAQDVGTVSRHVSSAGLNLAAPGDQAILYHRIAVAAAVACRTLMEDEAPMGDALTDCLRSTRNDAWAVAKVKIAAAQSRTMFAARGP